MAPFSSLCAAALLLAASARAHFTLLTPPSIGFDDDKEGTSPCGGFTPDFTKNVVDFHVGGEPVGTSQSHPSAHLLYRATLDQTASGNWTQLYPIVLQNSLGFMCQPAIPAPDAWVGKKGVLSVVANGDDGLLYQCVTVNFVSGKGTADSSKCRNSTTEIVFGSDSALSALVGGSASAPSGTGGSNSSNTGAASTPTTSQKPNAAAGILTRDVLSLGGMLAALNMVVCML